MARNPDCAVSLHLRIGLALIDFSLFYSALLASFRTGSCQILVVSNSDIQRVYILQITPVRLLQSF